MSRTLFYSFLVGTGALGLSIIMILIAVPVLGDSFQKTMFINSVIGCYGIGSPVSYFCLRQADKLRDANKELHALRAELETANNKLIDKVRHDQMTGLLSREFFLERVGADNASNNSGSLLIIDADHFKNINDYWGHLNGDKALIKITDAIKSSVRDGDIVGRIGGEEFGVYLPGATSEVAREIAERVRRNVEELVFVPLENEKPHPLTVSIGGVEINTLADMALIMGAADRNLYKAKNDGRNKVVCAA